MNYVQKLGPEDYGNLGPDVETDSGTGGGTKDYTSSDPQEG